MRELLHTTWCCYGGSDVPWWLMLPLGVAAAWLLLRWLRAERRRVSLAARLLPLTAVLFTALAVLLIVQPVLVRVDTWATAVARVVVLDDSASMDLPLAGSRLTARLDALTLVASDAVVGRSTRPRDLAVRLTAEALRAQTLVKTLQQAQDEEEQDLPVGAMARGARDQAREWLLALRASPLTTLEALRLELLREDVFPQRAAEAVAAPLTALADTLAAPPPEADAELLPRVRATAAALSAAPAALHTLQAAADEVFVAAQATGLQEALATAALLTRSEAAQHVMQQVPPPYRVVSTAAHAAGRDATDLYGTLARVLDTRDGNALSEVILLSDGGQNVPPDTDVPLRLRRAGIRLTVVGVGLPETEPDLALLDWRLPAFITRNTETHLRVRIKTITGNTAPIQMQVRVGDTVLAAPVVTPHGGEAQWLDIPLRFAETGRQLLHLAITTANANPANDQAVCAIEVRTRSPRALLVANEPDWDTTYWCQAARTAGLAMRQYHTSLHDGPLPRGGGRQEVPETAAQWSRNDVIVLHGVPFAGFAPEDAQALYDAVVRDGSTLVLLATETGADYLGALATLFGWSPSGAPARFGDTLALVPDAAHLPLLRVGADGAESDRLVRAFHPAAALRPVPAQHLPLVQCADDDASLALSLGFYGRGKVVLCGLVGLQRMAEYEQSDVLARLLLHVMADAAVPVAPTPEAMLAVYPDPALCRRPAFLVSTAVAGDGPHAGIAGTCTALGGVGNRIARWVPEACGVAELTDGEVRADVTVVDNPGLEQMYPAYNEAMLTSLAQAAGGDRLSLTTAAATLAQRPPERWTGESARRYAPASHWLLPALLVLVGTLHWVLRKLSGLAM